jgi:hypothetical protein
LQRVDPAARLLPGPDHLAIDSIYAYHAASSMAAAAELARYGLWW